MSSPILHTEGHAIVGDFPKIMHDFLKTHNCMFASPPLERASNALHFTHLKHLPVPESSAATAFLIHQVRVITNNVVFIVIINDHHVTNVDNDKALNRVPKQTTINQHRYHCQK